VSGHGMLLAYDAAGNVVATLSHVVRYDDDGSPLGLVDFMAHEEAGGEHTAIWVASGAVGSKVWPEWLGARAHAFLVELTGPPGRKRISALIHRTSGYRRERDDVDAAIAARAGAAARGPVDLRDVVGGPDRPIALDDDGRTSPRRETPRPALPLVRLPGRD